MLERGKTIQTQGIQLSLLELRNKTDWCCQRWMHMIKTKDCQLTRDAEFSKGIDDENVCK